MQVILKQDIKGTGRAHTAVTVADGHALNFLIPRGLAVQATAQGIKVAEARAKALADRKELDVKLIEQRLEALVNEKPVFRKKANEKGHLYDGVDAKEIAEAVHLPEEAIRIERPFKELGTFEVPVSFGSHFGKFSILIETE
jgi:large subunit ribosomal protein L9